MPFSTMESMNVLSLISRARDEVDEYTRAFGVKIENILLPWIYNAHDGIVEKALKALKQLKV